MLYIIHGTDIQKARTKVRTLVKALLTKKPDALEFRFDDESLTPDLLDEHIMSAGLFSQKYIVVLDHVYGEHQELLLERVKDVADSDNIFIFLEGKLLKKDLTKLGEHAASVDEYALTKTDTPEARKDFNVFALTDALGRRNPKELWVLYQKAQATGLVPEELFGTLMWQVKTMLQVARADDPKELGVKPFVITKAKGFLKNYSEREIQALSAKLVRLHHDARRGLTTFDVGLEQVLLNV